MNDRFSININNGQADVHEAFTVLRNGGTISQSGLVGITNITRDTNENPLLPETLLNLQANGYCDLRMASRVTTGKSRVQLLTHGNTRASGVELSFGHQIGATKPSGFFDISLISPSGNEGNASGVLSISENGVTIGSTHLDYGWTSRPSGVVAPLVIHQESSNSGTIALKQQADSASAASGYGQIYVKEYYVYETQGNALFYKDPSGVELNLSQNPLDVESNLFFHDVHGNTFAGKQSPQSRDSIHSNASENTSLGYRALYNLATDVATGGSRNVAVGHQAGQAVATGDYNIAIGTRSDYQSNGSRNTTLGYQAGGTSSHNDCVIIGNLAGNDTNVPDATLLIGTGTLPLISGSFSDKTLTVRDGSFNCQNSTESIGLKNYSSSGFLEVVDRDNDSFGSLTTAMAIVFTTSDKESGVLMNFKHNADPMSAVSASTYHPFTDTPDRPYAELNGDLRLLGDIKFSDGTYLSSTSSLGTEGGTGIKLSSHHAGPNTRYNLDFETLTDSLSLSDSIDTSQSFIAISVPSGSYNDGVYEGYPVTRLSVQGLTDLVESGFATVGNNCNMLFTSTENEIDTYKNRNSVFVGCSAGSAATGWKNGVFIGTEAGKAATTPNGGLPSNGVDTPVVFIGNSAGFDADNVTESIFIGNEAGKNSSGAEESIFIGPNAGTNSNFKYSIGIGKNALFGGLSTIEGGSGNIEMTTAVHGDSRLFYGVDTSNKVNIGNVVAGDMENKKISIGVAELSPSAILDVKFSSNANHSEAGHVQAWWTDDNPSCAISSAPASGFMQSDPNPGKESILRPIFMDAKVGSSQIPKNGGSRDDVQIWVDGFATSPPQYIKVTNRGNSNIAAHRFIVVVKMGNEYRAINGL